MKGRCIKGMLATGLAAAILCAAAGTASAADHFVTSPLDDNSDGTLRKEVADAGNGDTVIINPGVDPAVTSVEITIDADITIRGQGTGATTVDADSATVRNRAFNVLTGVTATIESLRITEGQAADGPNGMTLGASGFTGDVGGGIRNAGTLTLDSVRIDGCSAGKGGNGGAGMSGTSPGNGGSGGNGGGGGGVFSSGPSLTVIDSTIVGNQGGNGGNGGAGGADFDMGGLGANGGNGGAGGGGAGIAAAGALTVNNSTIQGNTTGIGGNGGGAGNAPPGPPPAGVGTGGLGGGAGSGGGIATSASDATSISNSTITANIGGAGGNGGFGPSALQQGGNGGFGGGIAGAATVTITHATIAGNAAGATGAGGTPFPGRGGGVHVLAGATTSRNSIFSANTAPVATNASCNGTVVDAGNNLSPGGQGCPAGFGTGNPMLSALASNGGPTQTMAISAAGAADDAVAATGENCTATDQRGFVRPQGAACDIGAFEITVPALLTVARAGTGSGTVNGTGITCGADCTETVPHNSVVVLNAVPASGSTFAGWTGCDSASGATCTQTLGSNETVTANFALTPVVSPPVITPPVTTPIPAAKKCKKGQKLKKGKCVKKKRKKKG